MSNRSGFFVFSFLGYVRVHFVTVLLFVGTWSDWLGYIISWNANQLLRGMDPCRDVGKASLEFSPVIVPKTRSLRFIRA